jgi:hypothetical protein
MSAFLCDGESYFYIVEFGKIFGGPTQALMVGGVDRAWIHARRASECGAGAAWPHRRIPRIQQAASGCAAIKLFSLSQANPREPPGQVKQNPLVVEQITPFTFGKLVMFLSATGSKINFSCMPCNTGLPRACLVCKKQI